ncbi:molybdenum cofactor biosynthesis protein MoaE [Halanaerobium congolense]|jgi:molybdopterin synthase catalytic subunit|uniref:molybdenum cofactor biosynthesis protein MoaE n=1 Tax=Halanaerobium congolense TaxID=54121 RepID=UPI000888CF7C|nr:molybdenum cofactor biosynthesis protein MoaE [Halanaerobium congolense]SDH12439.1 Molybdopterin synthase catalytic subunit [Halanaerobium congolense]SHM99334.1 Molybdopterin synthase catalytic subunit [Halanaerobium congolense]
MKSKKNTKTAPSMDKWLQEAKSDPEALNEGMYLVHNGIVRQTSRAKARQGVETDNVTGMDFDYNAAKVDQAVAQTKKMAGIFHVRVWLNQGQLEVGEDIMYVLIGGDIRPHTIDALQFLVAKIKNECVKEIEKT